MGSSLGSVVMKEFFSEKFMKGHLSGDLKHEKAKMYREDGQECRERKTCICQGAEVEKVEAGLMG